MIGQIGRVAWRAFMRFQDHKGPDRAAAVAYYTLLSLLPMLWFMISIGVAILGSVQSAYDATMFLVRGVVIHLDEASLEALRKFVQGSVRFQWPAIILLAWTSRRIFVSLFGALETVFEVPGRSFATGNLVALVSVLVVGAAMLMTLAFTTFLAALEGTVRRLTSDAAIFNGLLSEVVTTLLPLVITLVFFFLLYRLGPRRWVTTGAAVQGALLATVLWELAKAAFAYYVRNVAQIHGVYGALEGLIVLALWLEVSVSIILYCGEVVALLGGVRAPHGAAKA